MSGERGEHGEHGEHIYKYHFTTASYGMAFPFPTLIMRWGTGEHMQSELFPGCRRASWRRAGAVMGIGR